MRAPGQPCWCGTFGCCANGFLLDLALGANMMLTVGSWAGTSQRVCACDANGMPTQTQSVNANGIPFNGLGTPTIQACRHVSAGGRNDFTFQFGNCPGQPNTMLTRQFSVGVSVELDPNGLVTVSWAGGVFPVNPLLYSTTLCFGTTPATTDNQNFPPTCASRQGDLISVSPVSWTATGCSPCGPPPNTLATRLAYLIQRDPEAAALRSTRRFIVPGFDFNPRGCADCGGLGTEGAVL